MARLSGPKGWEVRDTCKKAVDNYVSDILDLLETDSKEFRWWYLDTLADEFTALCRRLGYELDRDDPRN